MAELKKNIEEDIKQNANHAISWAKSEFKLDLDYSEKSLQELEKLLQEASNRYKNLTEQKVPTGMILTQTVNLWGAYLGEYIQKKYGGHWENVNNEPLLRRMNTAICPHNYIRQRITSEINVNVNGYLSEIKNLLAKTPPRNQDPNSQTKDSSSVERKVVNTSNSNNQIITSGLFTRSAKNHFVTAIRVTAIALAICGGLFLIDKGKVWFSILFFFSILIVKFFWDEWNENRQISLKLDKTGITFTNPVRNSILTIKWEACEEVVINDYGGKFKYLSGNQSNYLTEQWDEYENPRQIKEIIESYMEKIYKIREERKREEMRIQREQELLREQQRKQQERQYFKRIQDHENLLKISPIEFEEIVGKCFRKMGYFVEHTPKSHDEGIDLKITKNGKLAVVQCKRYNGSVGQPVLRDLYGSMIHNRANESYLVTTGKMTQAAKTWATGKPITLIAGADLVEWIQSLLENDL